MLLSLRTLSLKIPFYSLYFLTWLKGFFPSKLRVYVVSALYMLSIKHPPDYVLYGQKFYFNPIYVKSVEWGFKLKIEIFSYHNISLNFTWCRNLLSAVVLRWNPVITRYTMKSAPVLLFCQVYGGCLRDLSISISYGFLMSNYCSICFEVGLGKYLSYYRTCLSWIFVSLMQGP